MFCKKPVNVNPASRAADDEGLVTLLSDTRLIQFFAGLERFGHPVWMVATVVITLLVGVADYLTGNTISIPFFYVVPVGLSTWYLGRRAGLGISGLAAAVWLVSESCLHRDCGGHLSALRPWVNTTLRLIFFLVMTSIFSALRTAFRRQLELARTDPMTGAANNRYFHELAAIEISRASRSGLPLTLVYLDVDNFKAVNDKFGHNVGDEVLRALAQAMRRSLRAMDVVARVGGDEFAVLLPETDSAGARAVVSKLQERVREKFQAEHWPATLSLGVMTFLTIPQSVDQMIGLADERMYGVKQTGKNAASYTTYVAPGHQADLDKGAQA